MQKKITFFVGSLEKGGAERVISIISRWFVHYGYEVEILLYYNRVIYYEIDSKIKIHTIEGATNSRNLLKNLLWMRTFFKNSNRLLISFLAPFNIFAIVATFGLRIPTIVSDRNDPRMIPENYFIRKLRDYLYKLVNCVVVQTEHNKEYFKVYSKCNTKVIYNPVDLNDFIGLGLVTKKKKKIVTVARLMPQKNQKLLIDSFYELNKHFPEYDLFIYGEGPQRSILNDQINSYGLQNKIHLMGQVDDIFNQIVDSELFVLSSNYEGMPNALIEAMCLGLPVISTKVSGATDLIKNGFNGFLVECDNKNDLFFKMKEMLSDDTLRYRCAENAVKISDELKVEYIIRQWELLIEDVSNESL